MSNKGSRVKRKLYTIRRMMFHFVNITKGFGIVNAFHIVVMQFFKTTKYKHNYILSLLEFRYRDIINKYRDAKQHGESLAINNVIWVCWFQGDESMPKTIKYCYDSIRKYSNGLEVKLITFENYSEFVRIPSYIIDKIKCGKITLTHFSDILRSHLLSDYGGIWIDATLLLTENLHVPQLPFFSLKFKNQNNDTSFVSEYKWVAGFMMGAKGNVLHSFMKDFLNLYHKDETMLIDYFLVDYIIALAYNNITSVKKMIDDVPYTNEDFYYISSNLFNPVDKVALGKILQRTWVFRIGYKDFPLEINDNSLYKYMFN